MSRDRFMFDFDARPIRMLFRLLWRIRKSVRYIAIPLGFNDRLIEDCEVCGIQQPLVWHAPHVIWEAITGYKRYPDGEWAPGCLCPRCFDQQAEAKGILLVWVPFYHGDDEALLDKDYQSPDEKAKA